MSAELGWIQNSKGRVSRDLRYHALHGTEVCSTCSGKGTKDGRECLVCVGFGKIRVAPRGF